MKFVEVKQFGGPETLQLFEEADLPPQAGQIAVDVKAAGINYAEIMAREGKYPGVPSAPFRPGYEVAGVVTARGEGVEGLSEGARVMAFIPRGGYTSRIVLNATDAIPIPDSLEFGSATALLAQGLTAYFLLEAGALQAGQSVLVAGAAGGVGSLLVQIAKLKGAGKIIGLASASKHERVRSLGADTALDYTRSGWAKEVLTATDGKGFDLFLDSQGDLGSEAFDAIGDKAHWVVYGVQAQSGNGLSMQRLGAMIGKSTTLRGYTLFADIPKAPRALGELIGWATGGQLTLDVQSFPLADVAKAHEAISNRQTTGKVVLVP